MVREYNNSETVAPSGLFCLGGIPDEPEIDGTNDSKQPNLNKAGKDSFVSFCVPPAAKVQSDVQPMACPPSLESASSTSSQSSSRQSLELSVDASHQSDSSSTSSKSGTWPAKDITRKYSTVGKSIAGDEKALQKEHIFDRLDKSSRKESLLDHADDHLRSQSILCLSSDEEEEDDTGDRAKLRREKTKESTQNRNLLGSLRKLSLKPKSDKIPIEQKEKSKKKKKKHTNSASLEEHNKEAPKKQRSIKKLARMLSIKKK